MRKRNLLAAGAILSLTGAGLFHPSQAITSCQENGTCRDLTATAQGQAPDVIPWERVWALDNSVAAPAPVRYAEHTAYNTAGDGLKVAKDQLSRDVVIIAVPSVREVLADTIPNRDVRPPISIPRTER